MNYRLETGTAIARSLATFMGFFDLVSYNAVSNHNNRTFGLVLAIIPLPLSVVRDELPFFNEDAHHPALSISLSLLERAKGSCRSDAGAANYNFKLALSSVSWDPVYNSQEVEIAVEKFYKILYMCLNANVLVVSQYKHSKYPPWFSRDIVSDQMLENRLSRKRSYSRYHEEQFKLVRSRVKAKIARAYSSYVRSVEERVGCDLREFWKYVNNKRFSHPNEEFIKHNDRIYKGANTANAFADLFSSNASAMDAEPLVDSGRIAGQTPCDPFSLTYFSREDVVDAIKLLNSRATGGPDKIPAFVVKGCWEFLCGPLHYIFNLCIRKSEFPGVWKCSRVTPVFKSGNRSFASNYTPIAILNVFAKIFERILYKRIFLYVQPKIVQSQHGFLPDRSTVTNLLEFVDKVSRVWDVGGRVDEIYKDFSKAFDTFDNGILLDRME
ncbi:uncharacterized protein LOC120349614 [Nilaparvata lugens]|uniref:uncharacterized protein LOC120349613 n=1 Tax=Nilaparvata lugens TaxID=108931 RepID=UPI00193E861B|nr:uncharacterized protein LOC120349613 [Nilaparvata lugens]XP_039275997.1 uncharacterized protein LOC120349614 [Nilaparvata lugens]